MSDDNIKKLKKSFIPKSLRPDVPGQYYSQKKEYLTTTEVDDPLLLLKNASIDDITDYQKRRKIILSILTQNIDRSQYEKLNGYKEIIDSMFPNIKEKLERK